MHFSHKSCLCPALLLLNGLSLHRDKETELQKQKEHAKEQAHQADKALEEFKLQVEKSQNQIYSEMKQQVGYT